jgi:tight adherence protein C
VIAVLAVLALAVLALAFLRRTGDPRRSEGLEDAWQRAIGAENSAVGRVLLSVSRPVSKLPYVHLPEESAQYKAIRQKLNAADGAYTGQVEIFLSVQILHVFLGSMILVALIASGVTGMALVAGGMMGAAIAALPWNRVWSKAKKRADAVTDGLPQFAELLLMPLSSGYGVMPALDFTAARLSGPVAEEVRLMLSVLASRARTESEAFTDCAERLGTPEAMSFFTALMQAYLDGVKVVDNLRGQATALRKSAHERTRARLKTLPNKLVFIIALHLLPMLFVVALMPTLLELGNL